MKRSIAIVAVAALTTLAVGLVARTAAAATAGSVPNKATYGATNVTTAAPLKVFTASLVGRNTGSIQNKGPNSIYCGFDNTVTTSTGTEVAASGGFLGIDITWNGAGTEKEIWCIAASADQSSPNNTRWMQVR